MILGLLIACLTSVTHAQGWSYPVVSIEVPRVGSPQSKDLIVTDGNHIHQVWRPYSGETRVGYNIVLPDGTVLLTDRMLSQDTWSAYESISEASDTTLIAFWRQNYSPIWYTLLDNSGNTLIPPTLYSSEGSFTWHRIDSSPDSLGRIHIVRNLPDGSVCYSVLEPGVGEVFRDTIPDSWRASLVLVDGSRVHIKYVGRFDDCAYYIQYDLNGNVTVPPVNLVDEELDDSNRCSMTVDSDGNAMVFLVENPNDDLPRYLSLYRIDKDTGFLLLDRKIIYWPDDWTSINDPVILPCPGGISFYLLWLQGEVGGSTKMFYIKFAIIDEDGNFIEEPYIAYDYSDEEPEDLEKFAAAVNSDGDVFAHWSAFFPEIDSYYIVMGWFDHNWVGIEDQETELTSPAIVSLVPSTNPFNGSVHITATGLSAPAEMNIYDIYGRLIRTLFPTDGNQYYWDGYSSFGKALPQGSYVLRVESDGIISTLKILKLE